MESLVVAGLGANDYLFLAQTLALATSVALAVFLGYFYWLRWEKRRLQKRIFRALMDSSHEPDELFLTDSDAIAYGELIAQFKVNHGKQVVSVLESDGKRFVHVAGDLSPHERTKMMHYLKSEGFMS